MSRIADALTRSPTRPAVGLSPAEDGGHKPLQFFAPEPPAALTPQHIRRVAGAPSTLPRPTSSVVGTATGKSRFDLRGHRPATTRAEKLLGSALAEPVAYEQYRTLATSLLRAQQERGIAVVMVTSTVPGEGKTLTAANLALTFSESYKRGVLLVDADLRRPSLHQLFGIANESGLSDALIDDRPGTVAQVGAGLSLLTAGTASGDPMRALSSDCMRVFVEDARASFDWIILDTAPAGLVSDAKLLASMADATLIVVRAGHTQYDAIQQAIAALDSPTICGVVLNAASGKAHPFQYSEYYHGASGA